MRILRLGLLLALASGFAAIWIYITGLSEPSVCMYVCIQCIFCYPNSITFFSITLNLIIDADLSYHLTDEEAESLLSLHNSFQKCVVRFLFSNCLWKLIAVWYLFGVYIVVVFWFWFVFLFILPIFQSCTEYELFERFDRVADLVFSAECKWTWSESS